MKKLVNKEISSKILMVGEYFKNNAPGGMAAVLASYDMYFEDMKFIPTWKYGTLMIKIWYTIYSYILFLLYMLFDRNIKIVHIQGAAFASFERNTFFVRVGKFFGKKIIMHMHCADFDGYFQPSRHKRRILETINSCDKYFVLSDSWKEYFIGIGVNSNIIVVLNNTVAPPTIRTVNRNNTKIKLLYLGVIGERKGVYDLLEAIWSGGEEITKNIQLRIGGNKEEDILQKKIKDYGLNNCVTFEGFVADNKKIECLNWADIFILPSYNEGLPIAILEAMSYGCPIISTTVGGIPVVVKHGVNGYLINPGNITEIQNAILSFIHNRDKIEKYGRQSLKLINVFLPETVFRTLCNLYKQLL